MIALSCLKHVKRNRLSNGSLSARPDVPPAYVLLSVVYDRSGSMASMDTAARAGLNDFVMEHKVLAAKNKKAGTKTFFTLTTFDSTANTYYEDVDITTLSPFTATQMQAMCAPGAMTRLVDTMYEQLVAVNRKVRSTIAAMPRKVAALHPKIVTIFLAITDGGDNMSTLYMPVDLNKLVARSRAKGMTIIFLGANQDAIRTAAAFGIGAGQALTFGATPACARAAFRAATQVTQDSTRQHRTAQSAPAFTQQQRNISAPAYTTPPPHQPWAPHNLARHMGGGGGGRGSTAGVNTMLPFAAAIPMPYYQQHHPALASLQIPPPAKMTRMSTVAAYK